MAKKTLTRNATSRQKAARPAYKASAKRPDRAPESYGLAMTACLDALAAAKRHGVDATDISRRMDAVQALLGKVEPEAFDALALNQAADFRAFTKGLEEPEKPEPEFTLADVHEAFGFNWGLGEEDRKDPECFAMNALDDAMRVLRLTEESLVGDVDYDELRAVVCNAAKRAEVACQILYRLGQREVRS